MNDSAEAVRDAIANRSAAEPGPNQDRSATCPMRGLEIGELIADERRTGRQSSKPPQSLQEHAGFRLARR